MERLNLKMIVRKLFLSLLGAAILTSLFCFVYTIARDFLIDAIAKNSIGFLKSFDLIGKIQEKCHFETIPTIWQLQETFNQIVKFFIFAFGLTILLVFMPIKEWKHNYRFYLLPKRNTLLSFYNSIRNSFKHSSKPYLIVLLLLMAVQYATCYSIIYYSWWSGDDYYAAMTTGKPFIVKYTWWIWCCLTHVARIGEMIYYLFPLTEDRTAHLLITPILFSIFPLLVMRLVAPRVKFCSLIGCLNYVICACFIYLGLNGFSTFCCYAPCTAYIYSSIFVIGILPFYVYKTKTDKEHSVLTIILFSLCSFIFGTSTEGIAAIFSLLLLLQLIYKYYKGYTLSPAYYFSLITFWIGATWILFSPGTGIRGMNTPFTGGNVPYNFYGMSLLDKLSYLPEMIHAIWNLTYIAVMVYCLVLLLFFSEYLKETRKELKKIMLSKFYISLAILVISILMAIVYIAGAIPNGSSFTPCSFGIICADIYLLNAFLKLSTKRFILILLSIVLFICNVIYIYPSLTYSVKLKPYELIQINTIKQQIAEGKNIIILSNPYPLDYTEGKTNIPHGIKLEGKANKYYNVDKFIENY